MNTMTIPPRMRMKWFVNLLVDLVLSVAAFTIACVLERGHFEFEWKPVLIAGAIAVVVTLIVLMLFRCYRIVWKYAGVSEMLNVVLAYFVLAVIFVVAISAVDISMTYSLAFLYVFFDFMLIVAYRFRLAFRYIMIYKFGDSGKYKAPENIIVYGAGFTGAAVVKRFISNPKEGYHPVAIIDDDPAKRGQYVSGIRVVGTRDALRTTMRTYKAKTVVIAITEINREQLRQIYEACRKQNAVVKVISNLRAGDSALNADAISLKNINIEDLLRRPEHKIDQNLLDALIKDKVVMVTGGVGSIGSELSRQALKYGCKHLVIFDHYENGLFEINEELSKIYETSRYSLVAGTVKDRGKLRKVMEEYKPEIVLHAAAYKHVPMMEINADEAVKNNIFGTKNVIDQCEESGVKKFILISTDKAVNPANVMGASKRMAELLVQAKSQNSRNKTVYAAVRFGNVLGSNGSVIPTFIRQINAGGPVTVTHREMKRYFMTIPEAVRLVLQAGALARGGEVFVLDMGEPMYIYDLATDLIRLSGLEPERDIRIEITGLRPGEKLFEELRFNSEEVDKTRHEGIFVTKLEKVDTAKLNNTMAKLKVIAEEDDREKAERVIFDMIPTEYRKI